MVEKHRTLRFVLGKGSGSSAFGGFPRGTYTSFPTTTLTEEGEEGPQRGIRFLGQVDLSSVQSVVPVEWLPEHGILYFFWDTVVAPGGWSPQHSRCWHVHFEAEPPSGPIAEWPQSWPESEEAAFMGEPERIVAAVEPDNGEPPRVLFLPVRDELLDDVLLTARLATNGIDAGGDFNLDESEVVRALSRNEDLRVLLQLEQVDGLGWEGFDQLNFVVDANRAARGDFGGTWAVVGYEEGR